MRSQFVAVWEEPVFLSLSCCHADLCTADAQDFSHSSLRMKWVEVYFQKALVMLTSVSWRDHESGASYSVVKFIYMLWKTESFVIFYQFYEKSVICMYLFYYNWLESLIIKSSIIDYIGVFNWKRLNINYIYLFLFDWIVGQWFFRLS